MDNLFFRSAADDVPPANLLARITIPGRSSEEKLTGTADHIGEEIARLHGITEVNIKTRDGEHPEPVLVNMDAAPETLHRLTLAGTMGGYWQAEFLSASEKTELRKIELFAIAAKGLAALFSAAPEKRDVTLGECRLEDNGGCLPSSLWSPKLACLRIWNTRMPYLPGGIETATELQDISVRSAGLKAIPETIGSVPTRHLNFEANAIESVPELHQGIISAVFASNVIRTIPDWATDGSITVNIRGNPVVGTNGNVFGEDHEIGLYSGTTGLGLQCNQIVSVPPWMPREELILIGSPSTAYQDYMGCSAVVRIIGNNRNGG